MSDTEEKDNGKGPLWPLPAATAVLRPQINMSHIAVSGSVTGLMAEAIEYFSKWPIQPPTHSQAETIATLLLLLFAGVVSWRRSKRAH